MDKTHRIIIIFLVLFTAVSLYFYIPAGKNFSAGPDESQYFKYATLVSQKGLSILPAFVNYYGNNVKAQLSPSPARMGHIILTALWVKIFGVSYTALAKFSFFCYLLFVITCFYFSRKFFGDEISYLFTLLISSAPLIMAMGKRALADSSSNLFWALSIWTFMDFLATQKKSKFLLFLAVYSFSITVKESSAILMIFFIVFFLVYKYYFKNPISDTYLLKIIFLPLVITGVFYIILLGGIPNFLFLIKSEFKMIFISVDSSEYAKLYCAGPWYKYLIDYLLLSPITTLLFLGYSGYLLVSRKWDWNKMYLFLYFVVIFGVFSTLKYGKIARFVMDIEMVIALFSILMLYELFRQRDINKQFKLIFISALAIFLVNYLNFYYFFCQYNIYDPVTCWLLAAMRIIPYK